MKSKTYKIKEESVINVKRFHLPFKTNVTCPSCKHERELDLNYDYLGYPSINKKESHYLYCTVCDIEFEIGITLNMSLIIE